MLLYSNPVFPGLRAAGALEPHSGSFCLPMADRTQSTTMHRPAATAPTVTGEYAQCAVCGVRWQVHGDADTAGCVFCGASGAAVSVKSED